MCATLVFKRFYKEEDGNKPSSKGLECLPLELGKATCLKRLFKESMVR